MKIRFFLLAAMLTLLSSADVWADGATDLSKGSLEPAWKLQDLDGNWVSSEDFKGKVVILDFWATWCWLTKTQQSQ
jgi:thiol-disulfide isomerase/thioredoxin